MSLTKLPSSSIPGLRTIEITSENEQELQRFFEANPQYFLSVNGEPAGPNEAHVEIHGELPSGWSLTKKWLVGYVNAENSLVAFANVVSDLLAPSVWHIGLLIVATSQHGTGDAQAIHRGLETWAISNGANWLRLGVVKGNVRAERFWEALGYIETRTRVGVEMGKLTNTLRVMVKPLANGSIEQYLSLVPRDRPELSDAL